MTDAVWASMSNAMKIVEEADALLGTYDRAIAAHNFGRFFLDVDDWTEETLDDGPPLVAVQGENLHRAIGGAMRGLRRG